MSKITLSFGSVLLLSHRILLDANVGKCVPSVQKVKKSEIGLLIEESWRRRFVVRSSCMM